MANEKSSKKNPISQATPEAPEETAVETANAPANEELSSKNKESSKKDSAAITLQSANGANLVSNSPEFIAEWGTHIVKLQERMPTDAEIEAAVDALPEEQQDAVFGFLLRMSGNKEGLVGDDGGPDITELRLYQGTGSDPLRPPKLPTGEFYLTTGDAIGEAFIATPLIIWKGSTMWPDANEGGSRGAPECQTMDRKMGSAFGPCAQCPNRPWKDGEPQKCTHDILALMLKQDLSDIVLVRFSKTSEPAGKQLIKMSKRGLALWSKWYRITSEEKTSATNKSHRWYNYQVAQEPGAEGRTPKEINDFCRMMSIQLQLRYLMPKIAWVYQQAADNKMDMYPTTDAAMNTGPTDELDDTNASLTDMSDAPEV
jgi:hypothetical protein